MAISQLYAPRVQEIQRKYKNNPEKQQEELTKLQKEGYNPTGGCGTMMISMLILFGIIGVVYKPMTHMEHFKKAEINSIIQTAEQVDIAQAILASPDDAEIILAYKNGDNAAITLVTSKDENGKKTSNQVVFADDFDYNTALSETVVTAEQLSVYGDFDEDQIKAITSKNSRLSSDVKNNINKIANNYYNEQSLYGELRALKTFENTNHRQLFELNDNISTDLMGRLENLLENMYFGPINLIDTPTFSWSPLLLIPFITLLFAYAQTFVQQYIQKKQNPQMAQMQNGSTMLMFYIMPLISVWISFSVPAGAGFYWALSYLFGLIQLVITAKFWPADKIRAEAKAKMEAAAAKAEQRATVIEVDADGNTTEKTERLSQLTQKELKELNRRKLEAARKADAEKYGEEYIESDDDDF